MSNQRPVNLDLTTLHYPPMAVASILHRISGVVLFLGMPILLYWLHCSLVSPESFLHLKATLAHAPGNLVLWLISSALVYHGVAGIRHVLMDCGLLPESLPMASHTAVITLVVSILGIIFLGVWLW